MAQTSNTLLWVSHCVLCTLKMHSCVEVIAETDLVTHEIRLLDQLNQQT